jgi:hypothetical protein
MYYAFFNSFSGRLDADLLPPSFNLDQADGVFVHQPLLFM